MILPVFSNILTYFYQFITCDGGIVELGAEIQYGIVDVVTMVSEVADHQDILRLEKSSL